MYCQLKRSKWNAAYVALGSSFAAGLGLGKRALGSPLVSQRGSLGYPQRLASLLQAPSFTDMTSSGATIKHVLNGGQLGLPAQVSALGPDTKLVTLTAGGNDVGYVGDMVMSAYGNRPGLLGSFVKRMKGKLKPLSARDFPGLQDKFVQTVHEIRRRSPKALVVVVTYPSIIPPMGTCSRIGLTQDQASILREVGGRLQTVTCAAASLTGALLVDMTSLSSGHDACSIQPWVNGTHAKPEADFHPTLAGAAATAQAILERLNNSGFDFD